MVKSKTSLLIGGSGFIGMHLAEYLEKRGERVFGTYNKYKPLKPNFFSAPLFRCNVKKPTDLSRVLKRIKPDTIYYLAAQSSVRLSWEDITKTTEINLIGGLNLLNILKVTKSKADVVLFSSGTCYGLSHQSGKPLPEDAALAPMDPYSITKAALEHYGRVFASNYGLSIKIVRLGNLTGPGQDKAFAVPNFAYQVAVAEKTSRPSTIKVGNLDAIRDFLDVRDGVRAVYRVAKHGRAGEIYNVCSGRSRKLRDVLNRLITLSSNSKKSLRVLSIKRFAPKNEIRAMKLSNSKIKRKLHWKPAITLNRTLCDMLSEHRYHAL